MALHTLDRAAVVIVDMQNGFCHPEGSFGRAGADVSGCGAAAPACEELVRIGHDAGIPVVWTRAIHENDLSDWRMLTEVPMYKGLIGIGSCVEGTWDAEFFAPLAPADGDLVVSKSRFSPFVETDIADRLRALGVENLLVGGVGTSACVESTVRDASQRDFRTYVVTEATGDISPAAHEHSLHVMGSLFGWTVALDDVRTAAAA
ncbi:cysteine hydrolase [Phytohabitans flavus]|uniref:Isochorismatase n=1 Tax=Phytohabitans flavus TaxID=1076124 RepID=A0A6F8XPV8_9ACTN|nr:isochorismatase family cysteine hydrolase [Phytohabitans flavus]BCB75837.1 isochorismatase [Phytohabitans flavus]